MEADELNEQLDWMGVGFCDDARMSHTGYIKMTKEANENVL